MGKLVQKMVKQMIKADLGVIQALFDFNTVFTVKQNNSHKDCSIFNLLKFIETLRLNFFFSSPFSPLFYCLFFTSRTDISSLDLSNTCIGHLIL